MADVLAEAVVELEADTDKFNKEFKSSLKQAEKDAKKSADEIDNSFKQMTGDLGKEFERATREIARQFREQEREAKRVAREIEREAQRVAREVERESREAQREIERETARVARENIKVQKEYEREFIASQRAMEKAARESQERTTERFRQTVDSLRRFASEKFSLTLGVDSSQITGALSSVSKLGAALGILGVGALAGSASLAGLAQIAVAVQELAGAIALLPAAGAAASVVVGTLALGLRGLSDAISADSPAELSEAFEKLSKNGQKFVTAIRDLKDEFEDLGKEVQNALLAEFNVEVEKLGKVFLPLLRTGFVSVAKELNLSARALTEFLREGQTVSDVQRIFENTRQSVFVFRSALRPAAQALRDLAVVGSDFLPVISAEIGGAAKRFGDFIREARASGELHTFFENAIDSVRDLIDVVGNLGSIFNAVSKAAKASLGGGFLDALSNITQGIEDFVESTRGQLALVQFFEGAQEAVKAILPVIGELAHLILEVVLPAFTKLGTIAAPPLHALLSALRQGLEFALPGILSFVNALGDVVEVLVSMGVLDSLGNLVRLLGDSLGQALTDLAPDLANLVNALLTKLAVILPKILPALSKFASAFADLVIAALPVVDVLAELISSVGLPTLQRIAEKLTPIIGELADGIGDALLPVLPELADAFGEWVDAMAPLVDDVLILFVDLLKVLAPLLPSIVRSSAELAKALRPLFDLIVDIVTPISAFITKLYEIPGVKKFMEEELPFILALLTGTFIIPLGHLLELLDKVYTKLKEAGVFDILISALTTLGLTFEGARKIIEFFGQVFDTVFNFLKDVARASVTFIADVIIGTFNRIRDFFVTIWETIKNVFITAWNIITTIIRAGTQIITSVITGNFGAIPGIIGNAFQRLRDIVDDAINRLMDTVRGIPGRITGALGNLGSLLYGAGQDIVRGMISGIGSMIGSLASEAANMARSALNAAKNALLSSSPSRAMMVVGEDFGKGFAIGIDSMVRRVSAAGADLANQTLNATSAALEPTDGASLRMNEKLNKLTRDGFGPPPVQTAGSGASEAQNAPVVVTPEVYVYIGNEEINDYVTEVVDERDRRKRISLSMGARRTL